MYLTEIFLKEYYKNYSANEALIKCDNKLCKRMRGIEKEEDCERYFFYVDGNGEIQAPSEKYTELMSLWELYREVASDADLKAVKELWIMQMFFETACLEALWRNKNLKKNLTQQESKNLQLLVQEIYKPISKKYLVLLRTDGDKFRVWKKVNLDRFIDGSLFAEKEHVENQIMCMFRVGGIIVWVVGREGLTPQRICGYKVYRDQCTACNNEYLEALRDTVTKKRKICRFGGKKREFGRIHFYR